ncbi:MAG: tetratricopeptide 4, partial [Chloroflexi bacterium]|nr:tetratricopeptide 4 [Chloroflexota bacterium]
MEPGSEAPQALARRIPFTYIAILAILVVALWLRVFGPTMHAFDWGDGSFVHPDENFVSGLVSNLGYPKSPFDLFNPDSTWNPAVSAATASPPVNGHPAHDPAGFNYGSLPLYLIKIFTSILSWMGAHVPGFAVWQNANTILAGRILSGIFDTITVFLVFLLGKRLAGERIGLFAAALATFAVLSIQLAHFTTVDSFLTTFATGTVLASVTVYEKGRARDFAIVGLWLAAAFATKASAVPLLAT